MDIIEAKEILGNRFTFTAEDTQHIISYLDLPKQSKILDVGTGIGSLAIILAINGYNVLTGEPEDDISIYAKQDWLINAEKVGVSHQITFHAFDAKNMPFENASFDAIFFLGSFHHIIMSDRERVLHECVRICKSNAIICMIEPNPDNLKIIKELDPTHPNAADPSDNTHALKLTFTKIQGKRFDAFIFRT